MSELQTPVIACDTCGLTMRAKIDPIMLTVESIESLRQRADKAQWTFDGRHHTCRKCQHPHARRWHKVDGERILI